VLDAQGPADSQPDASSAIAAITASPVALDKPGIDHSDTSDAQVNSTDSDRKNSSAWREEVADKLMRYQARRKPRPPRYPSLQLRFEGKESNSASQPEIYSAMHDAGANSALALSDLAEHAGEEPKSHLRPRTSSLSCAEPLAAANAPSPSVARVPGIAPQAPTASSHAPGKIIQFPRSSAAPPLPLEELAEPVIDRPRILEAPALVPPPPALGGITIEASAQKDFEKRPGIDIPLRSAPLYRRILAACIDALVVAAACAVFGLVFWKVAAVRPPLWQIAALAIAVSTVFWAAYQYAFILYSRTTLGLLLAGLELTRFDGAVANRRLRRWRVLASFLSAASLGMGYLWVFLDEDSLCWHDRITHTYLAPGRRDSALGK
jgi:uncharacterized RDD family membrane protein YckC